MERLFLELLNLLLIGEIELESIAEARAHRAIGSGSDAEDIDIRVEFALYLFELERFGRDFEREVDASDARGGVKIRKLGGSGDGAGLRGSDAGFEVFFNRITAQQVVR